MRRTIQINENFDRLIEVSALELIGRALREAENEIHHPGAARNSEFDLLDLIDQAREAVRRAQQERAA